MPEYSIKEVPLRVLLERRESVKAHLRTIHSDLANPARLIQQIEQNQKHIDLLTARNASLLERHNNLQRLLDGCLKQLETLNEDINIARSKSKIETLKNLARAIAKASEGTSTLAATLQQWEEVADAED